MPLLKLLKKKKNTSKSSRGIGVTYGHLINKEQRYKFENHTQMGKAMQLPHKHGQVMQ